MTSSELKRQSGNVQLNDQTSADKNMDIFIGGLLRTGVLLSATVVLVGAIIYLGKHGDSTASYSSFQGEPASYRTAAGILRGVVALRGRAIIQLGLVILIATPVARVAFSIFAFFRENDRLYATIASVVLVILLYSLIFS